MTRLPLVAAALFAAPAPAAPPALVRVAVSPQGPVWVGQRVTLTVTLLAPGTFAEGPYFDLPEVPGAVLVPPQGRPVIGTETVGDARYTTQAHDLAVFARRPGALRVPPIAARFATGGPGMPSAPFAVTTAAQEIAVRTPPGAEGLPLLVSTTELTVEETWRPHVKRLKVGDAVTRAVAVRAAGVFGMVLPPFRFEPVEGLALYPRAAEVTDQSDGRGSLAGRRVDTITYVCEVAGTVTVPALTLTWWDLQEQKLKRVRLPARVLDVEGGAPPEEAAAPPETAAWPLVAAAVAAALLLAFWLLRAAGPAWRRHRATVAASEPAAFACFRRACRDGDAPAAYRALLAWFDRFAPAGASPTLECLAARAADAELAAQIDDLQDRLFGRGGARPESAWDAAALARRVGAARRRLLHTRPAAPRPGRLAPLNPSAAEAGGCEVSK